MSYETASSVPMCNLVLNIDSVDYSVLYSNAHRKTIGKTKKMYFMVFVFSSAQMYVCWYSTCTILEIILFKHVNHVYKWDTSKCLLMKLDRITDHIFHLFLFSDEHHATCLYRMAEWTEEYSGESLQQVAGIAFQVWPSLSYNQVRFFLFSFLMVLHSILVKATISACLYR